MLFDSIIQKQKSMEYVYFWDEIIESFNEKFALHI